MPPPPETIASIVAANERLLRALITLLAIKDQHLLGELQTAFRHAQAHGNGLSSATSAALVRVRKELKLIANLIGEETDDHPAANDHNDAASEEG